MDETQALLTTNLKWALERMDSLENDRARLTRDIELVRRDVDDCRNKLADYLKREGKCT